MAALFLPLLLVVCASLGARDQVLVARLRAALGRSGALLALALLVSACSAALAALAGAWLAGRMSADAAQMFLAFALLFAAIELALKPKLAGPAEPTRSLGAIGLVLLVRQIGDAARFLIAALSAYFAQPEWSAVGGALGGMAAVGLGWAMGADLDRLPLRALRGTLAALLFGAALWTGLAARGILG